jgi:glycosyltransferase involved in cell wall biosynthesis
MEITILIPVYNDSSSLLLLIKEIENIAKENQNLKFTILIVDDDSSDSDQYSNLNNFELIKVQYLKLKHNMGHQKAIFVGMIFCQYHNIENLIIMDGDGEDKPQDIIKLIKQSEKYSESIIVAKRSKRENTFFFKFLHFLYKLIFRFLTGKKIDFGNFCFMKKKHIEKLLSIEHVKNNLIATILKSKTPISKIILDRGLRFLGKPKMNYERLIILGLSALSVFSREAMVRIIVFSLLISIALFLSALVTIYFRFFTDYSNFLILGQATTIVSVLLTIGILVLFNSLLISFIYNSKESNHINRKLNYKDYVVIEKIID